MIAASLLALTVGLAATPPPASALSLGLRETISALRWLLGDHGLSGAIETAGGAGRGSIVLRGSDDEEDGAVADDDADKTVRIGPLGIVLFETKPEVQPGSRPPDPGALLPVPPRPPSPPSPPSPPPPPGSGSVRLRRFSLDTKDAPAVDVLHRIAQSAGWSLTIAGVGDDRINLSVHDVDPREAVRTVLKASHAWGVLRGDRLIVLPAEAGGQRAGELIERRGKPARSASPRGRHDLVHVFQGDLVVPRGTVVGDATVVGGSLNVEPGALVQGDAVVVGGSLNVEPGGLVMGDGVALLGGLDVEPGGQVLGEQVQMGVGRLFKKSHGRSWFSGAGLFGFFPTLALFALLYLVGLLALFAAPERLRGIGATLLANPARSFAVGFLTWLLALPVVVLLCVTLVGIPLVPLVPLALFLAFALGLSAVALRIGELLPAGPGQKFLPTAALGMGMGVVALTSFVPLVGFALIVLVQFAAVGAVVASRIGKPPVSSVPQEAARAA